MTVVNPKSISGINSITMASGSDNLLTIHTTNTTERIRINSSGDVIVGSGITVSPDGDIFATGVTTSTTFVGDLTGTASKVSVAANNDNTTYRVPFTSSDTGNVSLYSDTTSGMTYNPSTGAFTVNGVLTSGSVSSGAISGTTGTFSSHVSLGDSDQLRFGDSNDLVIQHNGTDSLISDTGNGDLYIRGSDDIFIQKGDGSETFLACNDDGPVEIYHNNVKVIETHPQGAAIASGGMTMPAMNSFSSQILVGASGFIGNYHDGTTNQQLIIGTNQYFESAYKSRTNTTAAHIQFYDRSFRFNTAAAPGSAGGVLTQVQALRIDTDGVKFGTDTAAANALDDYEEGSWTPSPTDGNNTFVTGQEYGRYTKIGNVVHCTYSINCSISGTSGYALFIQGLPFTVRNFSAGNVNEGIGNQKGTGTEIDLEAQQGQTRFKFRSPSSGSALTPTNVGCVNNVTKSLIGSISYITT